MSIPSFEECLYSISPHYISNSGKDEHSSTKGGAAGDQTGHEWEVRKWYSHPWNVILRYPDITVATLIAHLSYDAAMNDNIGYDQSQRTTYWTALKEANYFPQDITKKCEADCTSGVAANIKAVGCLMNNSKLASISPSLNSRTMRNALVAAGFKALTSSSYISTPNNLLPGDILLYESHHVATNISYGKNVTPEPARVIVTGNSVYIRTGPSTSYSAVTIVHKGDVFPYVPDQSVKGWYAINYEGELDYISSKYSRLIP